MLQLTLDLHGCILSENLDDVKSHFIDDFDYPRLTNQSSLIVHC